MGEMTDNLKTWQDLIDRCPLPGDKPKCYGGVSHTQLSIARYSGGANINGAYYVYVYPIDALIREDVFKWAMKENDRRVRTHSNERRKPCGI
jgi:hypothetical protein